MFKPKKDLTLSRMFNLISVSQILENNNYIRFNFNEGFLLRYQQAQCEHIALRRDKKNIERKILNRRLCTQVFVFI